MALVSVAVVGVFCLALGYIIGDLIEYVATALRSRGEDDRPDFADEIRVHQPTLVYRVPGKPLVKWQPCRVNASPHWCTAHLDQRAERTLRGIEKQMVADVEDYLRSIR